MIPQVLVKQLSPRSSCRPAVAVAADAAHTAGSPTGNPLPAAPVPAAADAVAPQAPSSGPVSVKREAPVSVEGAEQPGPSGAPPAKKHSLGPRQLFLPTTTVAHYEGLFSMRPTSDADNFLWLRVWQRVEWL